MRDSYDFSGGVRGKYCGVEKQVSTYLFTVYQNPKDYPDKFVVRRWRATLTPPFAGFDAEPLIVCDTLEDARAPLIHAQLFNLGRSPGDDPVIVEVWI